MPTFKIRIKGIVQGVGFRPYVYQQALADEIRGTVSNGSSGVIIFFNAESQNSASNWLEKLVANAPRLSKINSVQLLEINPKKYDSFEIIASQESGQPDLPVTPDFALCKHCKRDIDTKGDKRYRYAFTTCCHCGPRYSITRKIPYDRPYTTMESFDMCPDCIEEYHNPLDRRHFSQTNSCPECGVELSLFDCSTGEFTGQLSEDEMLKSVRGSILKGQIVAVKGIGGYLLLCDATSDQAVLQLRERKIRPGKPFAVMYPAIEQIRERFDLSAIEVANLAGPEAPIVLLEPKKEIAINPQIAPGLGSIGVMIPYAPLLHLIAQSVNRPLIATSANVSGSTIVYDNEEAIRELGGIADWILMNNRDILVPQDDSVVRFTHKKGRRIILRRSRGLAPNYSGPLPKLDSLEGVLATGAEMKGAFAFVRREMLYISQYLGSMNTLHSQNSFEKVLHHLTQLTGFRRNRLLADAHPAYFGNRWMQQTAENENLPSNIYQHHEAHFASVLAENELLDSPDPVLGFIWDGTGLAPGGQIWGSETFLFDRGKMKHLANAGTLPHISGDQMSKQPRISLLAFSAELKGAKKHLEALFTPQEIKIYTKLIEKSRVFTSSMGRLFDAVSCLITGITLNTYEGEAAMRLEAYAREEIKEHGNNVDDWILKQNYSFAKQAVYYVCLALEKGLRKQQIALNFHNFLVNWIAHQSEQTGNRKLAFSGGVFQNAVLVDLIESRFSEEYELYFHSELSPNDENIAHGQLMMLLMEQNQDKSRNRQTHEVYK